MNTSRAFVRPVAIATIALVAPLLMVSSGEAATTDSGCTVAPKRPKFTGDTTGGNVPIIEYKSTVTCDAGLVLNLEGKILESDQLAIEGDAPDDLTGTFSRTLDFTAGAGTQTVTVRRPLPNTGPASEGPREEMYQSVRFNVTSGPVTSQLTDWELTQARSIHH